MGKGINLRGNSLTGKGDQSEGESGNSLSGKGDQSEGEKGNSLSWNEGKC